jgi:hypothetical protein
MYLISNLPVVVFTNNDNNIPTPSDQGLCFECDLDRNHSNVRAGCEGFGLLSCVIARPAQPSARLAGAMANLPTTPAVALVSGIAVAALSHAASFHLRLCLRQQRHREAH